MSTKTPELDPLELFKDRLHQLKESVHHQITMHMADVLANANGDKESSRKISTELGKTASTLFVMTFIPSVLSLERPAQEKILGKILESVRNDVIQNLDNFEEFTKQQDCPDCQDCQACQED